MEQNKIDRINELARLAKERELTGAAIDLTKDGLRVRMTGPDGTVHLDTTIARK